MISLVPSESWGGFKWVRASARNLGAGLCPAQSVWQGSGFAADQTNAMLAVVRADDESLVPPQAAGLALSVARPLPTEIASLGFGGSPVVGGDKNSRVIFFTFLCVGGITYPPVAVAVSEQPRAGFISAEKTAFSEWVLCADGCVLFPPAHSAFSAFLHVGGITTLRLLWLCRNNPARGLFRQKKRLSQSGCSAPTNALFPPAHSAFLAFLHGGGITTLGVRFMPLKRWTPAGHGGVFTVFMPPQNSPCAG